jgi:chromosome segregation ATPase
LVAELEAERIKNKELSSAYDAISKESNQKINDFKKKLLELDRKIVEEISLRNSAEENAKILVKDLEKQNILLNKELKLSKSVGDDSISKIVNIEKQLIEEKAKLEKFYQLKLAERDLALEQSLRRVEELKKKSLEYKNFKNNDLDLLKIQLEESKSQMEALKIADKKFEADASKQISFLMSTVRTLEMEKQDLISRLKNTSSIIIRDSGKELEVALQKNVQLEKQLFYARNQIKNLNSASIQLNQTSSQIDLRDENLQQLIDSYENTILKIRGELEIAKDKLFEHEEDSDFLISSLERSLLKAKNELAISQTRQLRIQEKSADKIRSLEQKLKARGEALIAKQTMHVADYAKMQRVNTELRDNIQLMQEVHSKDQALLDVNKLELEKVLIRLEETTKNLTREKASKDLYIKDAEKLVSDLKSKLSIAESNLSKQVILGKKKTVEMQNQLEQLNSSLKDAVRSRASQSRKIEEEKKLYQNQIEDLEIKIKEYSKKMSDYESALNLSKVKSNEDLLSLKMDLKSKEEALDALDLNQKDKLESASNRIDALTKQISTLQKQNKKLSEQNAKADAITKKQTDFLRNQLEEAESEMDQIVATHRNKNKEVSRLISKLEDRLTNEMKEKETISQKIEEQQKIFDVEIEKAKSMMELNIKSLKQEYGNKVKNFKSEKKKLTDEIIFLEKQLTTAKNELETLSEKLGINNRDSSSQAMLLKNQLAKLQNAYDSAKEEYQKDQGKVFKFIRELEKELVLAEQNSIVAREQSAKLVQDAEKRVANLTVEISFLKKSTQTNLRDSSSRIEALKEDLKKASLDLLKAKKQIDKLQLEKQNTNEALTNLKNDKNLQGEKIKSLEIVLSKIAENERKQKVRYESQEKKQALLIRKLESELTILQSTLNDKDVSLEKFNEKLQSLNDEDLVERNKSLEDIKILSDELFQTKAHLSSSRKKLQSLQTENISLKKLRSTYEENLKNHQSDQVENLKDKLGNLSSTETQLRDQIDTLNNKNDFLVKKMDEELKKLSDKISTKDLREQALTKKISLFKKIQEDSDFRYSESLKEISFKLTVSYKELDKLKKQLKISESDKEKLEKALLSRKEFSSESHFSKIKKLEDELSNVLKSESHLRNKLVEQESKHSKMIEELNLELDQMRGLLVGKEKTTQEVVKNKESQIIALSSEITKLKEKLKKSILMLEQSKIEAKNQNEELMSELFEFQKKLDESKEKSKKEKNSLKEKRDEYLSLLDEANGQLQRLNIDKENQQSDSIKLIKQLELELSDSKDELKLIEGIARRELASAEKQKKDYEAATARKIKGFESSIMDLEEQLLNSNSELKNKYNSSLEEVSKLKKMLKIRLDEYDELTDRNSTLRKDADKIALGLQMDVERLRNRVKSLLSELVDNKDSSTEIIKKLENELYFTKQQLAELEQKANSMESLKVFKEKYENLEDAYAVEKSKLEDFLEASNRKNDSLSEELKTTLDKLTRFENLLSQNTITIETQQLVIANTEKLLAKRNKDFNNKNDNRINILEEELKLAKVDLKHVNESSTSLIQNLEKEILAKNQLIKKLQLLLVTKDKLLQEQLTLSLNQIEEIKKRSNEDLEYLKSRHAEDSKKLKDSIASIQKKWTLQNTENQRLKDEIDNYTHKKSPKDAERLNKLLKQNADSKETNEKLNNELISKVKELERLQLDYRTSMTIWSEEKAKLLELTQKSEERVNQLKNDFNLNSKAFELERAQFFEKGTQKTIELKNQLKAAVERVREIQEKSDKGFSELQSIKEKEIKRLIIKIEKLKNEYENLDFKNKESQVLWEKERKDFKKAISILKGDLVRKDSLYKGALNQVDALEISSQKIKQEQEELLSALTKKFDESQLQLKAQLEERKDAKNQIQSLEKKISSIEEYQRKKEESFAKDLARLKVNLDKQNAAYDLLMKERIASDESLVSTRLSYKKVQEQAIKSETQINVLTEKLMNAVSKLDDFQTDWADEKANMNQSLSKLEKDLETRNDLYEKLVKDSDKLRKSSRKMSEDQERLLFELDTLKKNSNTDLEELKRIQLQETEVLENSIQSLEKELSDKQIQINKLELEIVQVLQNKTNQDSLRYQSLIEELNASKLTQSKLKNELASKNNELKEISDVLDASKKLWSQEKTKLLNLIKTNQLEMEQSKQVFKEKADQWILRRQELKLESTESINQFKARLNEAVQELENVKDQMGATLSKIKGSNEIEVQRLKNIIVQLEQKKVDQESKLKNLSTLIAKKSQDLSTLDEKFQESIEDKKIEIQKLRNKYRDNQNELSIAQSKFEKFQSTWDNERILLDKRDSKLKQELETQRNLYKDTLKKAQNLEELSKKISKDQDAFIGQLKDGFSKKNESSLKKINSLQAKQKKSDEIIKELQIKLASVQTLKNRQEEFFTSDLDRLKNQLSNLIANSEFLEERRIESEQSLNISKNEYIDLEEVLRVKKLELVDLNQQLTAHKNRILFLEGELTSLKKNAEELEAEWVESSIKTKKDTHNLKEAFDNHVRQSDLEKKELEAVLEKRAQLLEKMGSSLIEAQQNNKMLMQTRDVEQSEMESILESALLRENTLKSQVDLLSKKLSEKREQFHLVTKNLETKYEEVSKNYEVEQKANKKQDAELENVITKLREEIANLQNTLNQDRVEFSKNLERQKSEINLLEKELARGVVEKNKITELIEEERALSKSKIKNLTDSLKESSSKYDALVYESEELKQKYQQSIDGLELELDSLRVDMKESLSSSNTQLIQETKLVIQLRDDLEIAKESIYEKTARFKEVENKKRFLEESLIKTREELEVLQKEYELKSLSDSQKIENSIKEIEQLEDLISGLTNDLEKTQLEYEKQKSSDSENVRILKKALAFQELESQRFKEKLVDLRKQFTNLETIEQGKSGYSLEKLNELELLVDKKNKELDQFKKESFLSKKQLSEEVKNLQKDLESTVFELKETKNRILSKKASIESAVSTLETDLAEADKQISLLKKEKLDAINTVTQLEEQILILQKTASVSELNEHPDNSKEYETLMADMESSLILAKKELSLKNSEFLDLKLSSDKIIKKLNSQLVVLKDEIRSKNRSKSEEDLKELIKALNNKLTSSEDTIVLLTDAFDSERKDLQSEMDLLRRELAEARNQISTSSSPNEFEKLRFQIAELKQVLNSSQNEYKNLKKKYEFEVQDYREQLKVIRNSKNTLAAEEKKLLEEKVKSLESNLLEIQESLQGELLKTENDYQNQLSETRSKVQSLNNELERLRLLNKKGNSRDDRINSLEMDLKMNSQRLQEKEQILSSLRLALEETEESLNELISKNKSLKNENQKLNLSVKDEQSSREKIRLERDLKDSNDKILDLKTSLRKAKSTIASLEVESKELRLKVTQIEEIDDANGRNLAKMDSLQNELEESQLAAKKFNKEADVLRKELMGAFKKILSLQMTVERRMTLIRDMEQDLIRSQAKSSSSKIIEDQLFEIKEKYANVSTATEQMKKSLRSAEEEAKELRQKLSSLQNDSNFKVKDRNDKLLDANQTVGRLSDHIKILEAELAKNIEQRDLSDQDAKNYLRDLRQAQIKISQLQKISAEGDTLNENLVLLKRELESLRTSLSDKDETIERLNEVLEDRAFEIKRLSDNIVSLNDKASNFRSQKEVEQQNLDTIKVQTEQISRLQNRMNNLQSENENLKILNQNIALESDDTNQQLSTAVSNLSNLQNNQSIMEAEIRRLQEERKSLERELSLSGQPVDTEESDKISSLKIRNEELNISLQTLKEQKADLAEEARGLESKLISLGQENELLLIKVNRSADKINELIIDKNKLEQRVSVTPNASSEVNNLKGLVGRLQDEITRRRSEFASKESEVVRLTEALSGIINQKDQANINLERLRSENKRLLELVSRLSTSQSSNNSASSISQIPKISISNDRLSSPLNLVLNPEEDSPKTIAADIGSRTVLKNAQLKVNASINGPRGVTAVYYKEFFVVSQDLESLLSDSGIQVPSGRSVNSMADLWRKSLKNGFSYPGIAAKIRSFLASKSVGRGRTNSKGELTIKDLSAGSYFIIGATSAGPEGTVWSQPIEIRSGLNNIQLTAENLVFE